MDLKRLVSGSTLGVLATYSMFSFAVWGMTPYGMVFFTIVCALLAALLWH